jgi:hypothetical protein
MDFEAAAGKATAIWVCGNVAKAAENVANAAIFDVVSPG